MLKTTTILDKGLQKNSWIWPKQVFLWNVLELIFIIFFRKRQKLAFGWPAGYFESRSFTERQMSGASSDNEWQRVTKNDNEWENEWQRETKNDMSDSEWQRVIKRMNTNKSS